MTKEEEALANLKSAMFIWGEDATMSVPEAFDILEKLVAKTSKKDPKYIPCSCGCNRRTTWIGTSFGIKLVCKKCGYSVTGKTQKEAKLNWNKAMSKSQKKHKPFLEKSKGER